MKKSIFRLVDRFELLSCYILCFCINTLFDYSKSLGAESFLLRNFLKQLYDYQLLFVLLLSFVVVIFHYQMVRRKKTEIHCRCIVGDTIWSMIIRYFFECLITLVVAFGVSAILNVIVNISIINNIYLLCVLLTYIVISSGQVRKYENI